MTSDFLRRWLLAGVLLFVSAPLAAAQGGEFEATVREALAEFQAGRWIEARTLFLRAHAIRPSAEALRMAGNASYEARDYVRATELLEASLAETDPALREDRAALAREALTASGRFVTRLTVVAPEGARVRVDDAERDVSQPIVVARGEHRLEVSAPGFETHRERVRLDTPERTVTLAMHAEATLPEATDEPEEPEEVLVVDTEPVTEPAESGSLTWLWVTLGVVGAAAIATVAILATRDDDPPLGANTPGRVIYALEFGR